jgi:hypothetical protein
MQPKIILTLLATLAAATTAAPTGPEAEAPHHLEKRGCPSSQLHHFQGGGCKHRRVNCHNQCVGKSLTQDCCPGTLTSKISGSGCIWGWSTCECACMKSA